MDIIKITEPLGVDYMEEFLIPDGDESKSDLLSDIKSCLETQPDSTLILNAYNRDGDEPILEAFLIASTGHGSPFVFVTQAWCCDDPSDKQVMHRLFFRLEFWADSQGKREIRGETTRGNEAFLSEYNFQTLSETKTYTIPKNFELRERTSNEQITREPEQDRGRLERTKTNPNPNGGSGVEVSSSTTATSTGS